MSTKLMHEKISKLKTDSRVLRDKNGKDRIWIWRIGRMVCAMCATCGEYSRRHRNITGCCCLNNEDMMNLRLGLDLVDVEVSDETIDEINNTAAS